MRKGSTSFVASDKKKGESLVDSIDCLIRRETSYCRMRSDAAAPCCAAVGTAICARIAQVDQPHRVSPGHFASVSSAGVEHMTCSGLRLFQGHRVRAASAVQ
jgi:hypothetical protein